MGHARNYITADVIRRVLEDYFGYRIRYVMNITDVDDKIIVRARRNYLLEQYKARTSDTAAVSEDTNHRLQMSPARAGFKVLYNR